MTATETVKSCIEKAVQGGWHKDKIKGRKYKIHQHNDGEYTIFIDDRTASPICLGSFNDIIFNKSFLKAFFGEYRSECPNCKTGKGLSVFIDAFKVTECKLCGGEFQDKQLIWHQDWKYHGNQLLLSDDRLKYLSKFL